MLSHLKQCNYVVVILILLHLNTGEQPNDSEVEQLLDEVEKYTLANHLFWGMWGIISVSSPSLFNITQASYVLIKCMCKRNYSIHLSINKNHALL